MSNQLIEVYYARGEYEECLREIGKGESSEYGLYIQGKIKRDQGCLTESLKIFRSAYQKAEQGSYILKEIGSSQYLLGQYESALGTYQEAIEQDDKDWELQYNCGLCYERNMKYHEAIQAYEKANLYSPHDQSYIRLAETYQKLNRDKDALRSFQDALDFSPNSAHLLTRIGLAYLRLHQAEKAFECLTKALKQEPRNIDAIIAIGSIIQKNDTAKIDLALQKYRIVAVLDPNCTALWNNVALALFAKGKLISAIACLHRANKNDPLLYQVHFNLGIIHLHNTQFFSAFQYFSAVTRFQPQFAPAFHFLALTLIQLQADPQSIRAAFHSAFHLANEKSDPSGYSLLMARLNFIIYLCNDEKCLYDDEARSEFARYIQPHLNDKSLDADLIERALSIQTLLDSPS